MDTRVRHRRIKVGSAGIFYREAGAESAPVVLLPHGYPCSSYEFRNLMPRLADRWRLIAPDFPGAGYSDTPDDSRCICTISDLRSAPGWRSRRPTASRR